MNEKIDKPKTAQVNPYDLPAIHRSATGLMAKVPSPMRQPYTLASSQRLIKSSIMLCAKRSS